MARGKKRTSFMKMTRDRELAEKRARKEEKRQRRRQGGSDEDRSGEAVESQVESQETPRE